MTEPVQMMLPFDDGITPCKQCYLKGCDCECATCVSVRERNTRLSRLELTRLSVDEALIESGIDPATLKDTMKYGKGF